MKDLMNRIHPLVVLAPNAAITDNTAKVGAIIDRKNYESLTYVLLTGTDADADADLHGPARGKRRLRT
jgi:hypothetical protein